MWATFVQYRQSQTVSLFPISAFPLLLGSFLFLCVCACVCLIQNVTIHVAQSACLAHSIICVFLYHFLTVWTDHTTCLTATEFTKNKIVRGFGALGSVWRRDTIPATVVWIGFMPDMDSYSQYLPMLFFPCAHYHLMMLSVIVNCVLVCISRLTTYCLSLFLYKTLLWVLCNHCLDNQNDMKLCEVSVLFLLLLFFFFLLIELGAMSNIVLKFIQILHSFSVSYSTPHLPTPLLHPNTPKTFYTSQPPS